MNKFEKLTQKAAEGAAELERKRQERIEKGEEEESGEGFDAIEEIAYVGKMKNMMGLKIKQISIKDIDRNEDNFYEITEIENLKQSISAIVLFRKLNDVSIVRLKAAV